MGALSVDLLLCLLPYVRKHYVFDLLSHLSSVRGCAELSMGPFCVTRSNSTHQLTDTTQPNPVRVEKFGPNPTQPNTNCHRLTLSFYYSF